MSIDVFLDAFGDLRRVGTLRRHPGRQRERVTYEHDPDWLRSPEAFQFDPILPLRRGPLHPGAGKEMFGTLGDSSPDTWGRRLMDRRERRLAEREGRRPHALHETDYLLGYPTKPDLERSAFASMAYSSPRNRTASRPRWRSATF